MVILISARTLQSTLKMAMKQSSAILCQCFFKNSLDIQTPLFHVACTVYFDLKDIKP